MQRRRLRILASVVVVVCILAIATIWILRGFPPRYLESRIHFLIYRVDLESLRHRINAEPLLEKIEVASPSHVRFRYLGQPSTSKTDVIKDDEYLSLLLNAGVSPVWRAESSIKYYLGASNKFGKNFQISFVSMEGLGDVERKCSEIQLSLDFGDCIVTLDGDWALYYEWAKLP